MSGSLWDAAETAAFLGMTPKWVEAKAREGSLPGFKPAGGRYWRFRPEAIREWVLDQERQQTAA